VVLVCFVRVVPVHGVPVSVELVRVVPGRA
jgi:hypothetical protein